jgi:hypothetical protein
MNTRKKNGTARGNLSEQVAVLRQQVESGHELILEKLKPLEDLAKLRADVDRHTVQIAWWKGGQAVVLFLLTAVLGFFGIHRR